MKKSTLATNETPRMDALTEHESREASMNCILETRAARSSSGALPATAVHKVPVVWSDCFWTAEIPKTTQLSEMIEIIHHRKALHHPGVAVASKEDRE